MTTVQFILGISTITENSVVTTTVCGQFFSNFQSRFYTLSKNKYE